MEFLKGPQTYLWLNIIALAFPLVLSFDKKVAFWKKWKYFLPAMLISGAIFIIWDIWFTRIGVWSFNAEYLTGIYLFNLPVEEWLFFFTIPYACVFIYECIKCWFDVNMGKNLVRNLSLVLSLGFLLLALLYANRLYTLITFSGLSLFLVLHLYLFRHKYLRNFYPAYALAVLPFFFINGILTAYPVVQYNDLENLSLRIGSIPFEDFFYGMLLILLNVSLFEIFRRPAQQEINLIKHQ